MNETTHVLTADEWAMKASEWAIKAGDLLIKNADLRTLINTQAAIIAAKNDEIESLRAELSACKAGNDYTGAILADDEAGMMLAAGQGG